LADDLIEVLVHGHAPQRVAVSADLPPSSGTGSAAPAARSARLLARMHRAEGGCVEGGEDQRMSEDRVGYVLHAAGGARHDQMPHVRMRAAYRAESAIVAEAQLEALAQELERTHPGAAGSLREGMAETLTVLRLGVSPTLARTLRSTNCIESMISIARSHSSKVKN
jgi:hypothetical protein